MTRIELTVERTRKILWYDPTLGIFTWLISPRANVKVGDIAGSLNSTGYRHIWIDGRRYYEHRLACLYMTGEWPKGHIDHINGDCSDNRWANLREATRSQNLANSRCPSTNKSGFKGVYWHKHHRRWKAEIQKDGRKIHLGLFDSSEAAHVAYVTAANHHFGKFARTA